MLAHQTLYKKAILIIPFSLGILYLLYSTLPVGQDWIQFFRPATLSMLRGESPYRIKEFNNAPWTLLPFIPFALLPYRVGRLGVFLLGFLAFAFVAYKLKAKPVSALMFMTSFPVVACLYGGGIDWMPMISFVTPAPIALIFAAMKPQVGIGIGFYWLIESWQTGGIKLIMKQFFPVSFLFLISFAVYGFWVATSNGKWNNPANISLFPYLLIIGVYLIYTRQKRAAMASSVCFAPYFTFFSVSAPLVALFEHPRMLFAVWLVLWAYPLLKALL